MSKKQKVTVSKVKKRKKGGSTGWVSSEDVKKKKVTEARAERLEKRGWKKSFDTAPAPKKEAKAGKFTITTSSANPIQKIKFGRKKKEKEGKTKLTQRERELRDFHTTGDPDFSYYDLGEAELNNPIKRISPIQDNKDFYSKTYSEDAYGFTKDEKKKLKRNLRETGKQDKKTKKEVAKDEKKAAKKTPEEIAKRKAKATDTVQAIGRAMMAFGGLQPGASGESAVDKLKKEKEKGSSESAPTPQTKTYSEGSDNIIDVSGSASEEFRRANPGESKAEYQEAYNNWLTSKNSPVQRKDLHNISSMMRKIKNPLKK